MPSINITGNSGAGGKGGGGGDDDGPKGPSANNHREANWLNSDHDMRKRHLRQTADYENSNFRARERYQRMEAQYENANFDQVRRNYRQEAQLENSNFDSIKRNYRQEAQYENANFDAVKRNYRQEAQYENQNFDARQKQARQEAEYHNKDINTRLAKQQKLGKAWDQSYYAATKTNNAINARSANASYGAMRYDANQQNNLHNRSAAQSYAAMRYNADQENRVWDQQNRPGAQIRYRRGGQFAYGMSHLGQSLQGRGGALGAIGSAASGIGMAGGLGNGMAAGALGPMGVGAIAAFDLAKMLVQAPGMYASKLDGLVAGAAPIYSLNNSSANLGRAGGFNGTSLTSMSFPGGKTPDWMQEYGLSPQGVNGLIGQTGIPVTSAGQGKSLVTSIMEASRSQYLGGMDPSVYAGMLGQAQTLAPGSLESGFNDDGSQQSGQSGNAYFARMQSVMQQATSMGLDHSKVAGTMMSMLQVASSSGSSNVDTNSLTGFWNRMASSGMSSMRDGSGVLAAQSGLAGEASSMGYGGNTLGNMALQNFVNKHGGMSKSISGVAKQLGLDSGNLTPQQTKLLQNAADAGKNGDVLGYNSSIQSLLQPDQLEQMNLDWAKSLGLTSYQTTAAAGSMGGQSVAATAAYQSGGGASLRSGSGSGWGSVNSTESAAIKKYAAAAGIDPAIVAATIGHESGFKPGAFNGAGGGWGAIGLGQIRKPALLDLQQHGMDTDVTQQSLSDADTNTRVTSDYLGLLRKRYGSDEGALQHYFGSTDANANSQYANSRLAEAGAYGYGNNSSVATQNTVIANQGTADTQAGKQNASGAQAIGTGPAADTILQLTGGITDATAATVKFAASLEKASTWLNWLSGNSGGGAGPHSFSQQRPGGARYSKPTQA